MSTITDLQAFVIHEAAGYQHVLVSTPLSVSTGQVNLRVMTRYAQARDPHHLREVLNLSLDARGLDRLICELQAIRQTL